MFATDVITPEVFDHCTPGQLLQALALAARARAEVYGTTMTGMAGYWTAVAQVALDAVEKLPPF